MPVKTDDESTTGASPADATAISAAVAAMFEEERMLVVKDTDRSMVLVWRCDLDKLCFLPRGRSRLWYIVSNAVEEARYAR